jgi:hypothetical protein
LRTGTLASSEGILFDAGLTMEPTALLDVSHDDSALRAQKAVVINRWRSAVWLAGGGLGVIAFGILTLLTVVTPGGLLVGSSVIATGALFLFLAGYELRAMRRAERELQARGLPWRAPRTLVPVARRDLRLPLPREGALEAALQAVRSSDPELNILRTKRYRNSVRAYTPTPILWSVLWGSDPWYPPNGYLPSWSLGAWQVITITAEERGDGTDLHVKVHPLTQQLGEDLADGVVEAIRRQVRVGHALIAPQEQ